MSYAIIGEYQWINRIVKAEYCSGCPHFSEGTNHRITSASDEPNDPDECGGNPESCVRVETELDLRLIP